MRQIEQDTQRLLEESAGARADFMKNLNTKSPEEYARTSAEYRKIFYEQVIGKFDDPLLEPKPRTRLAYETDKFRGYEVVLDVFEDVFAYGVLLVPNDLKEGEKRPVVVCQHGLEGRAQDLVTGKKDAYRDFAAKLTERGFITFAPQNPYIFTDRFSLPEHLQPFYTERPLYMPHMAFPSDTTRRPAGPPPSRAACGLPESGFVFCCFNAAYKILPEVFALWMRLVAAVPGSVLWLLETSAEAKENLRREAAAAGIAPQRLIFASRVGIGAHMARHAGADLFLDTYPYGAHTTANDALLAGLPVLTCTGDTLVSRICGSQLHAIGLPELVTESFAAYEALALELATEPQRLQSYRARLAANRATAPLFDMARYARDFEEAMARIWAEHAATP